MLGTRLRFTGRSVVAVLSAVCFLAMSMGSVTRAVAAEDVFETWPKKPAEPGVAPKPVPGANGAAQAGDTAGRKTAKGVSAGTIGWIAAGTAAVVGIAIAIGSGGGGSTSNH